jgi:hypothetical protein
MFEDSNDDKPSGDKILNPADRAREKATELCMHAELFAVFEGIRKFDAAVYPSLSPEFAREIQKGMARLEKAKMPDTPVVSEPAMPGAAALLDFPKSHDLSTNDYHIYRRPGEAMIVRWLAGDQVEIFYDRLQAHFDAALEGLREDERQAGEWKQDEKTQAYLAALDKVEIKMSERYLRDFIRQHRIFVLSTQSADEMNIAYLCDYVMGLSFAEVVGPSSLPPDEPTDNDLAWFFKLFSLRGIVENEDRMCFFAFLQKSDDTF